MNREAMLCEFNPKNGKLKVEQLNHKDRSDIGNSVTLGSNMAGGRIIKMWGNRNDLPHYRDMVLRDNNIIPELLDTKRNIALGHGLIAYREVFVDGAKTTEYVEMPQEISEWLESSDFESEYIDEAFLQWYKHANVFAEFITNKGGQIISVINRDCKYMRAVQKVDGVVPGYVYSPLWKNNFSENEKIVGKAEYVPAYNPNKRQAKFMLHIADNVFNDGYYGIPPYWGGVEWIRTSNAIPVFHESNIRNGYSVRFLVKYPEGYFLDKYEFEKAQVSSDANKVQECLNNETSAKQEFVNKINELLAGAANAGRAFFAEDMRNEITNEYTGITIEAIDFDMKDEALLKLYQATNQANISSQGIHPTLANIESQGKLSSGSEMRNAFLFYVLTKTPRPRKNVLKAFDVVCKVNGWKERYPGLKFTFEDFKITKLDEDKSGVAAVNEPKSETKENEE